MLVFIADANVSVYFCVIAFLDRFVITIVVGSFASVNVFMFSRIVRSWACTTISFTTTIQKIYRLVVCLNITATFILSDLRKLVVWKSTLFEWRNSLHSGQLQLLLYSNPQILSTYVSEVLDFDFVKIKSYRFADSFEGWCVQPHRM